MKIVNPFNLIMWVVVYVVTAWYFRSAPLVMHGRVGWASDEQDHAVAYDALSGSIGMYSLQPNGNVVEGRAFPDGSVRGWCGTPKVYLHLLHCVVSDYLDCEYPTEDDEDVD